MTSIKEALKIIQRTIKGDQIEAAVVDVGTMMPLGKVVSDALAQLDSADARGIAGAARKCADDLANIVEASVRVAHRTGNSFLLDRNKTASMIAGYFTALLPDASPGNGAEKVREALQIALGVMNGNLLTASRERNYAKAAEFEDYIKTLEAALHSTSAAGETTSSDGGGEMQTRLEQQGPVPDRAAVELSRPEAGVTGETTGESEVATDPSDICRDCGYREACDEKCPNCNDANEYGDYEGPTCEVCHGKGRVDLADRLERTTLAMARECKVGMGLWNGHSNACQNAIAALRKRPSEAMPADVLAMKEACKRAVYEADYLKDALANIDAIEIDKLSPEVKADASPPDWKQDQAETTRIKPPATAEGGRGDGAPND